MSNVHVAIPGRTDIILLPVADLRMRYDVRRELNEDRVLLFMELYESEAKVPPIAVVRGTTDIHDGRHRKAALEHLNRLHAECVLVDSMGLADLLMDAFAKNMSDAPFPPTREDAIYVIRQLLDVGVSGTQVLKRFGAHFRPSQARKLLETAQTNILKAKITRAKNAVAHNNMSVGEAAEAHGVELERLQAEITGLKKRRRANDIAEVKTGITNRFRSNSAKNIAVFRGLLEKFEDGELVETQVLEVLLHVQRLNQDGSKRIDSWLERFAALKGSMKAKS